ncbi:hypothetical protein GCM10011571_12920 [Marinithermofilum abyssi]|uniref:Calcineurin-like phosphoesterase domain-containing protein n=1 Tax=Marinithermofilum abyssi TaxID=1571185 RepID=A0A8J2YDQ7_9BACL|nr:DNA repair exonuclease [Marinithermofilum abyssi]GGE12952.1 hypothetical protein GCM10011571_12920 [Marinithermofilum abyssi]
MKPVTFVHTADLHLDLPVQGWKGNEEQLLLRREEYRQTFSRIVGLTKEKEAQFLLIAGDFLEHEYVNRSTVQWVMEQLERIPDVQVLIAPGNHDPYRTDSFYRTVKWPDHVHIFSEKWETHSFSQYDLCLYGKGFADMEERESSLPENGQDGERRLMLVHGTLGHRKEASPYFPLSMEELAPLEMDYVALGHIHQAVTHRLANERKTVVRYPGSPEALRWKETGERTVTVGRLDTGGIRWEAVPVHTRRYEIYHIDVTGCETEEELLRRIGENIPADRREAYLRLIFQGRRPREIVYASDWLELRLRQQGFFYTECMDQSVPDFDVERLREADGVAGAFVRRMEARIEQANEEEKEMLQEALYKGLEALLTPEVVHK